ncbi:hypothetical protein MHYP_G00038920 [Metynnis hypsauchen]
MCFTLQTELEGAGRRLRGPEQEAEDDSVCEEPEILEGERPRPQGSSPVEEFPTEKQAEEDSPHKSASNKKTRRLGFGSLFDKRSSAKMSETEDIQNSEAGMIVKTVKETCAEGLVVTGGGKEGIFIKEVKPDSPASKHLTVKEGDQILSATVFFDNVSYEDALQILEHAQPYKMELCLRRKMESTMLDDDESVHPEGNERGSPEMRSPRKKKHQDRISWPKFPSFGKGHRAQFKRSHSTSEAEEHKKLEMSPPTSDTESPLKSPLKSPDGKDKKKKQKIKIKMKMKSPRSMSVEESQRNQKELTSENLIVLEDEQVGDILDEKLPEKPVTKLAEIPQDNKEGEYGDSSKIVNEVPGLSGMESQHKVHLISLSNTLKTTDISDALAEASADDMMTSDEGKTQRSEMKFSIFQKDKSKIGVDNQSTTILEMSRIPDPSAHDTIVVSHGAISQAEVEASQLVTDIKTEVISKDSSEKNLGSMDMKMSMHKLDVSVDLPDMGVLKQSPRPVSEKQWKEGTIFENEIYGIRTRGPLADIVTSKSHFTSPVNGLQFTPPDSSEMIRESNMPETITVISQPELNDLSAVSAIDAKDPHLEIKTSRLPTEATVHGILAGLDKRSESKFKVPKVDLTGCVIQEPIKMTHLPKREDIEIPGMEDKKSRPSLQTPGIKVPKIEKIINITKEKEIQAQQTDEEFNVEDVKEAVSKFPALKLPEGDITGVLVQREITIMEMKGDKTSATPRGSPRKISGTSADSSITVTKSKIGEEKSSASHKDTVIKIPKVEPPYADEQTITMTKIDYSKPKVETQQTKADKLLIRDDGQIGAVKFKLPKREDIEIPGMEATEESTAQNADMKVIKGQHHAAELQGMCSSLLVEQPSVQIAVQSDIETSKRHKMNKHGDKKGQEKKSKKPKASMSSFGITKPDIRFPDVGLEIPKKDVPAKKYTREIREKLEADVPHSDIKLKDVSFPEHTDLTLYRMETTSSMPDQKTTDDFKITVYNKTESINLTEFDDFTGKAPKAAADISVVDVQDTKLKLLAESADIKCPEKDKEGHFVYVDMKAQDIKTEGQGRKFKLPKFEISFPEVKAPKISASKKEDDRKTEVPATHGEMPYVQIEKEADLLELHSKGLEMKVQRPTFQFPKFGFSKSESKEKEADTSVPTTDVSILEGSTDGANTDITATVCDAGQKDESKVGASTNVKLPSISNSKLGAKTPTDISAMEVHVKGPEEELKLKAKPPSLDRDLKLPAKPPSEPEKSIRDTQVKLAAEPQSADIKALEMHKEKKSVDMKAQDIETEGQLSKFKLPKFGIKLPEIKTPKIDLSGAKTELEISLPERKAETHPQDEVQDVKNNVTADLPELDSKGSDVKAEQTNFSFPRFGFSKSEVKISDTDVNLPNIDVSLPEGRADLERTNTNIAVSIVDTGKKDETKSGYPAKFKIPSIALPKFGTKAGSEAKDISAVHAQAKGTERSLKEKELELSTKLPDVELQETSVDMKPQSIQNEGQGSKFTLPTFGINLPEVKGLKIGSIGLSATKTETDISLAEVKMEVHPPDIELQGGVIEVEAEIDSKGTDVSLPKGNVELEGPNTDITLSMDDTGQKDETKFDSPTKFKLPSITLPKFGAKAPKGIVQISAVDVQAKGPEISLPEGELKFSAEPLSVDIKRHDVEKEETSLGVDMKVQDIQTEGQGIKFKLPKFGINLPEVKGPNIDSSAAKPVIDISLPEGKMEVHPPDAKLPEGAIEVKADIPEIDSESLDVKTKGPSFSFPKFGISKSEIKAPEADASLPVVDVSLPERNVELEGPNTDITVSVGDTGQKDETKFGSPTKFKLPSITLPKFGAKTSKGAVEVSAVDVQGKEYDISLPEAEIKLSAEPLSVDIKGPDVEVEKCLNVDMKAQDFEIEEQGSKFKLPKFRIGLPEVTGQKVGSSAAKTEIDISVPEGKMEVHPPDAKLPEGAIDVKADKLEIDSKGLDVKTKRPSFSFPKFGFSKSEVKAPKADASLPVVDVSLPEGNVELEGPNTDITESLNDTEQKDETKFGSPMKFKLPSITLPKFGAKATKGNVDISAVDVQAKGPEISLSEADFKLTAEPLSVDIKGPDVELEKSLNVDMKAYDIETEGQGSMFKLPKFGIALPEVTGPKVGSCVAKTEIDISLLEGKMEVHPPDAKLPEGIIDVKAGIPEIDSKGLDVKTKRPSFSFPKFGFSKSEVKAPKADASLPVVDVSLPQGKVELEEPKADITVSVGDTGQKDETKFGSPTKFKLPSITLPKVGAKASKGTVEISAVDVQGKGYDISLPEAELKLSAEPLSADITEPDLELKQMTLSVDVKAQDIQTEGHGSKFKLPKLGISLPEVTGPKAGSSAAKTEIDISLPKGNMEVHPLDANLPEGAIDVKADIPEIDSKGLDVKSKGSSFSFPKFGFSKSEIKAPKADVSLPAVDVSLPEGNVELEGPNTDITVSMGDTGQKDETKFGSPTKFKLPSITLPKFGAKVPKGNVDIPDVDVQAKGPEISLPEAELKLSAEPLSVDIKMPDVELEKSLNVDVKAQDIQPEGQGIKFKLPKFGIGLPEVKGPKISSSTAKTEIDISLSAGKREVHPPDAKLPEGAIDLKADIPEIDSKGLDVKSKGSSFSFPKFGFSKSEIKAPKADVSLPVVDVSLPEGNVELEGPNTDITVSMGDTGQKDETKFGSPTKFKLPSITLPKFGAKIPKENVDIPDVDVQAKVPEISLPEAELKLSAEPLSVDVTGPDVKLEKSLNVDVKAQDILTEGQGSMFKLPKFVIGLPEVTGPKVDSHAATTEIDISLPVGKMEVHPPDAKLPEGAIDLKVDTPEIDSKGVDVKTKQTSFSFPKFGFSKSEVKAPKADASLPVVDVSLPEGEVEFEGPNTDITVSMGDTGQKDETKFGSPTKFKLPSITLPKFGAKAPKGTVEISTVDVQGKGYDISLPEAELKLTTEPLSADITRPDLELKEKSLSLDVKAQDIQNEGQGMKFKLPKFGIGLPEIKGPKISSSAAKTEIDISLPEGKMEVHPPDVKLPEGAIDVKANIPEIDSKALEVKTKRPSFSFPKFGFSKSEMKAPKADASLPAVDVSLPEGKVELEGRNADITVSTNDTVQKDETKFGSPTKFKLPSITLPKFGVKTPKGNVDIPAVDIQAKGPDISLPETELKLSAEPLSVDIKGPDVEKEGKSLRVDMKAHDIQTEGQGIKFKLPKFGISLPEVKGPKIDSSAAKSEIDISLPEGKMEVHPSDAKLPEGAIEVKANIPEIDSESLDVKTKGSSFSFPKFGFSKSEMKEPKAVASLPVVDVSLPEGNVELEGPNTDITVSLGDTGQKHETKFKLPSITLPKFGAKVTTGNVDIPDLDVQAKGPEISLPEAELKLSAEPLSVDIKGPDVEVERSLNVDMKAQDIQIEEQGSKFKLPKFGINLPEVKGPKIGLSAAKTKIDVSLPEGQMDVHPPDAKLPEGAIEVKADKSEIDSKGLDVKTKGPSFSFPKFGFSKSEMKDPKPEACLPAVDVSLPERNVELEGPNTDFTVSMGDTGQKDETKFGSPTKFKLPSITLPKFGAKTPTGNADIPDVDVQAKGPEISLPQAELKLSAEPLSVDIKGPDVELEKSLNVDMKAQDIQTEGQGIKFKLPKFGIGLPEVKGPKISSSAAKTEIDISLSEGKMKVHPPDAKLPEGAIDVKVNIPEIDSKGLEVKTKGPSFSFPKFGFSKSEMKAPKADASLPAVDVSLPEGKVELEGRNTDITISTNDNVQNDETKFGSPTKFKLPSITLPKFGAKTPKGNVDIPAVDVQAKGSDISLPEAELKLTAKPLSVDIKGPDVEKEGKALSVDMKAPDIQTKGQAIKFKLPKFGISLPEVKGPKIDSSAAKQEIDISLPEGKMEVHSPDAKLPEGAIEVKANIPEIDSENLDVKTKGSSFSFPKFGFSKSEIKAPKTDASLPVVDVSLPEGNVELEGPNTDITVSMGVTGQKDETKFGSPTKFKLPSITLPKFGAKVPTGNADIPDVDVQAKGPEINLPEAELKLSAEPLSVDIKMPDEELERSLNVDVKAQDIQPEGQGIKFKLPKFGMGLPEVKGSKISSSTAKTEIDISLSAGKMEVHPPDAKLPEGAIDVKVNIPEIDSKGLEVKTKGPSFSFPKFGFSKSEVKAPKADASLPAVDVSLPEGKAELEGPKTDITVSVGDTGQKDETKFGSPTKFKLPSITLPKFGAKTPKGNVDIPAVDVQAKGSDISLPEAELKLTAKPLSVDIKGPDVEKEGKSLSVDMTAHDIQTEGQRIKFKLPKFGISLPEVKGPKIDLSAAKPETDISLPEGKMEVHPPDAKLPEGAIEAKADIPEIDSESLDVKTKRPSFSFPKFGFSKSEIKAPKADASFPAVDVSLPKGSVELEGPNTDITVSMGDTGQKDETKFGSPTKFKLPSITLPKFGAKTPTGNADIPDVDVQAKGPEISLLEAELKLSAEPLSVNIKGPDVELEKSLNVDIKAQDIQIEEQGSKFKLPKFGIGLPDVKGPKTGLSAAKTEIDISLPEAKMEVHPPDAKLPEGAIEVKADKPKIDSKGLDVKTKGPSFSFPKFGFSKSEIKAPKADASLPAVDVSLPEGKVELEGPKADITVSMGDNGQKDETFGSPTKFKLPSITLPKFGAKAPKGKVDMPAVDAQVRGHDISLPDTELALSAEPLPADVIVSDFNTQDVSLSVDMKSQNIHTEGQGSKFKLPKFGIGLPEVKGPKSGLSDAKKGLDFSLPEGKMEVHPPNVEISAEISVPEKDIEFNARDKHLKLYDSQAEVEIKGTIQKPPETAVKTEQEEQITLSKFKLPTIKMSKISISKTKSQDGENDTGMRVHDPEAILESKHKKETQGQEKSSKFTMPTLGDVLRGFDVEFNVPTLDETERAKTETAPAKLEFSLPSEEGGKIADSEANLENNEKEIMVQTDQKPEDEEKQTKPEKSTWFRFPKFSSPTKTVKVVEKESSQPSKENEESSVNDNKEKELELSSARETEEDSVSPTLSLRSSDAFADVSSAQTTEQPGLN